MSASAARRFGSALLGVTSMAASLGAIAFLITSDVAMAEERPEVQRPAKTVKVAKVEARAPEQAQVQLQDETEPIRKAPMSKKKKKRIDLGRFEGY